VVSAVAMMLCIGDEARADDPKDTDDVEDVMVRGARGEPGSDSSESLARAEVRQLPGAFGDPFRAVEAVPGMTPVVSGLPYFYIRGAPPGNVGYYFDGVRVPYLFHFGLGPAVIHPALIAKTELHRGGYPASLGRYSGGVIESSAMPPSDHFHGEASLRLIDAGALAEAPFADGRGTVLAAGRYSYTAALFSLLQSDTSLSYRDYQVRASYALTEHDTLSFLGFGAYDNAAQKDTIDASARGISSDSDSSNASKPLVVSRTLFASEFHRGDLRWDHTWTDGHLRAGATIGFDRTRVEARRAAADVMTAMRLEIEQKAMKGVLVRGGADFVVDAYSGDALPQYADDDDVVERQRGIFANRTDYATGAHIDAVITAIPRIELIPGVRADFFASGGNSAAAVDPRFSARFFITKKLRLIHAYGVASQPPSTPITLPGITLANLRGGLQRSIQTSGAVEADLPQDFTGTLGLFHNAFYNLNDALGTAQVELIDLERSDALLSKSRGSAYGLELGVRRKLSNRVGGLLSYTLSRSERTTTAGNGGASSKFISAYDRPHVLSAAVSVDLGRNWRAGARTVIYSGIPEHGAPPAFAAQVVAQPPERTPPFFRLDLRLEKRWMVGKTGWVSFVFEALNATLSREVTGYTCPTAIQLPGAAPANPQCKERVIGPVTVPSLGVEGGF
jgi:hypothetical protein